MFESSNQYTRIVCLPNSISLGLHNQKIRNQLMQAHCRLTSNILNAYLVKFRKCVIFLNLYKTFKKVLPENMRSTVLSLLDLNLHINTYPF